MYYIQLPGIQESRLVFYLAMEEYVCRHITDLVPADEQGRHSAFFMWQVPPTVIFGRNQVMEAEVNVDWCRRQGIALYRRKSGGGCVYSDMGNIMLSYISDRTDVASTFDYFLDRLATCLSSLGPQAKRTGRNDILIDGRKVSGNAFFMNPQSSIVHGTMLFNTDFDRLEQAITPSEAKISSKGVSSVRQHVVNFRELLEEDSPMRDIDNFKAYLRDWFCGSDSQGDSAILLNDSQIAEIRIIEESYLDPDFIRGRRHSWTTETSGKIEGVGEVRIEMAMEGEMIESCSLKGDFFPLQDGIDEMLTANLRGHRNCAEDAGAIMSQLDTSKFVLGLHGDALSAIAYSNIHVTKPTDGKHSAVSKPTDGKHSADGRTT